MNSSVCWQQVALLPSCAPVAVCAATCQMRAGCHVLAALAETTCMLLPVQNPTRTILGAPQTQYLKDQLSAGQGSQTWKVLGQQVCFQLPVTIQPRHSSQPACRLHAGPFSCTVVHLRN